MRILVLVLGIFFSPLYAFAEPQVGEPRTVRLIYFLPSDRPFRQEVVDSMKASIREVQNLYAASMKAHGWGNKTFRTENDVRGEPVVHVINGNSDEMRYYNTYGGAMMDELREQFDFEANVYSIIIDAYHGSFQGRGGGGRRRGRVGGTSWLTSAYVWGDAHGSFAGVTSHELGHAFGLEHDFRDNAYFLSYGSNPDRLSKCATEYLAVHPYFNPEVPIEEGTPPTIELLSSEQYPADVASIPIQIKVSDPLGVHQVLLFVTSRRGGSTELKACRSVMGEKEATVQFEFDGRVPSEEGTSLSDVVSHPVIVEAIDIEGDTYREKIDLVERSQYRLSTIEGHTDGIPSLAFSSEGLLASSSWDATARLWDVLEQGSGDILQDGTDSYVVSVAFSPEGNMLAVVTAHISLWDIASRQQIANLRGEGQPYIATFAPDGTTLAVGLWNGLIELWDVQSQQLSVVFRENSASNRINRIFDLTYSPDGKELASGSEDGIIGLWDLAAQKRSIALESNSRQIVSSVAYSPDGRMLATGSDNTVVLWNTETRRKIDTLTGHTFWISDILFLSDKVLVSGDERGEIRIWNVTRFQKQVEVFGHGGGVYSLAYLPGEDILASGSGNGTIALWDVGEWVRPSPADFDGDGTVGFGDFVLFAGAFGGSDTKYDLDGDGTVGFSDFIIFSREFGN